MRPRDAGEPPERRSGEVAASFLHFRFLTKVHAPRHLVLTVDADIRKRIEADCDDETVDEWLRDAVERKLDADEDDEYEGSYEFVDDCAI